MKTQFNKLSKTAITAFFIVTLQAITISATLAATITSASSGDWSSTTTWVGGVVPGVSDDVIITNTHHVVLSDNRIVTNITISNSGFGTQSILTIDDGSSLSVTNNISITSTGGSREARLNLIGGLNITGNIVFSSTNNLNARITMIDGSELVLNGIISNPSQGSILSDPGEISTFVFSGTSAQTVPFHSNIFYHHILINKSGSNSATLGGNITASNVYGNITVQSGRLSNGGFGVTGNGANNFTVQNGGTYIMTGTTTLPVDFIHNFQSGSTVVYSSNSAQTVGVPNAGNYHNISFEGSGTKTLAGNIAATGNINIAAGTLDASASNYNISIAGNWNNTGGTFNARNATVTYNGGSSQSIASNGNDFYNVVFNNTASGTSAIVLNSDVTITNNCTMTDGIINSNGNMLILTNTSAASLSGFSSACYVNGTLRRYVANNTSTYSFPVGIGSYQRFDVKNNNMNGVTYIDGSFSPLARHDDADFATLALSDGDGDYLSLAVSGMWTIDPNAQPSSGSYDALAFIANITGLNDNDFAIVKRPTGSPDASSWTKGGGTVNGTDGLGRKVSDGYALRMGLTSFSEFGIASTQPSNPLPVQLISFNAKLTRVGAVEVKWVTATEINNDFFSVERSADGLNFEEIKIVTGAGNTSRTLTYNTIDERPLTGTSYYRLKQTDFDGTVSHSNIVSVVNNGAFVQHNWSVFPNPIIAGGNVNITGVLSRGKVEVFEAATGRKIVTEQIESGSAKFTIEKDLSKGVYLVRISDENDNPATTQKLIVQ